MDVRIKASDYTMTPETESYINGKLEALSRLLPENESTAHYYVEVGRAAGHPQQGEVWRAAIEITHKGERFYVDEQAESVHAAIDLAKDEMLQRLRKGKGREATLMRRMGARLKRWARRGDMRSY